MHCPLLSAIDVRVVVLRRREHTHREFNPATDMNYSSSSPSLQKGEGQLIPSLTFVQRYECLREWLWTPSSLHSRAYFNPPPHLTQSRTLLHRTDQGKPNSWQLFQLWLLQLSTQINIWIFNVYSFPHRHDVMISNANYLGQCGEFLIML